MRILEDVNIDWLRWKWHSIILSVLVILAGAGLMVRRGLPLGIDFAGGTIVIVKFETRPSEDAVRRAIEAFPGEEGVQTYGDPNAGEILIRLPQAEGVEQGTNLEQGAKAVVGLLEKANLGKFEVLQTEIVGPVIGQDLQRKGVYATIASLVGIMLYIAFRFRFSFGVGAMVASFHDVLITLSLLTLAGYELSLNTIAAILTLVGYGVNDQIVIFDRVRENLRVHRREPIDTVLNRSVNQTLPRTVITAGCTALSVLSLYLFGGEVLKPFAFTMLVGIISSTYSTVFIASAIATVLTRRRPVASSGTRLATAGRLEPKAAATTDGRGRGGKKKARVS
jgi:preprotein translocase subunit SecF